MTITNETTPSTIGHLDAGDTTISKPADRLKVAALFGFLVGRRESILAAARDRATIWVGLLFVIAAGFAREYDGEDLRREPWHLLIPLAASVVISLAIHSLVRRRDAVPPTSFWSEYRTFLGLFWLTAPMALLYAIPYERMLSPAGSVLANLWTLGLVASWRVALMSRVVSVLTARSLRHSFFLVMLVADVAALVALFTVPVPVLQVMGGIRLTESEQVLQNTAFLARAAAVLTLPFWLIGALVARSRANLQPPPNISSAARGAPVGPLVLAGACVVAWALVLPATQREQRLRSDAERMLRSGRIAQAVETMSKHDRDDYPPAWDPPPRIGWPGPEVPAVLDVLNVIVDRGAADWVRAAYVDKFERRHLGMALLWEGTIRPDVVRLLERLPEGEQLRQRNAYVDDVLRDYRASATQPATNPSTGATR